MPTVNFVADNDVRLLHTGAEFFPALLAAIDSAQYEIYFETYIFADDVTGRAVLAALSEASRRGVQVRMITDWWGTGRSRIAQMHAELIEAGVITDCP